MYKKLMLLLAAGAFYSACGMETEFSSAKLRGDAKGMAAIYKANATESSGSILNQINNNAHSTTSAMSRQENNQIIF